MEFLKDYDVTVLYHLDKVNVEVDILSRNFESMSSLACLEFQGIL